jgi:hypothetical protein
VIKNRFVSRETKEDVGASNFLYRYILNTSIATEVNTALSCSKTFFFSDIITLGSSLKVERETAPVLVWLSTNLLVEYGCILCEFETVRNKRILVKSHFMRKV